MPAISRRTFLAGLSSCAAGIPACTALQNARPGRLNLTFDRPNEMKEFKDPEGRTVCQLTDNELESKHAYYDICPWNATDRYLAVSSANPADLKGRHRDNLSTSNGQVYVMNMTTFEMASVAKNGFYTTHNGMMPIWHPKRDKLYYRLADEKFATFDLETGKRTVNDGKLRQLSPDGTLFASQLNPYDRPDDPDAVGFYTMNEDGSDYRRILSIQQVYDVTPNKNQFDISQMTIGNPKWTPDSQNLLLTMWVHAKRRVHRSLYVADRDGKNLRWLTYFGHHHSWTPDGKSVLFNDWMTITDDGKWKEPRMFMVDFDGGNRRVVFDEPIGSHPCIDPTGTMIADFDGRGVFLVRIKEQKFERLATYRKRFDMSHKGTHPHCVWNHAGTHVLYNSEETGHSEIYTVTVKS
jgi:hypothetical protein